MIVADTNLIAYLLLPGPQNQEARAILQADPVWCAPLLWRSELTNVLALYLRRGHLDLPAALDHMEHALRLMTHNEYQVTPAAVLALADSSGCSAYDCEFVQLARELGVPMVTSDKKVLRAFPDTTQSMAKFIESVG